MTDRVLLVDDVVTTGGSILKAYERVRATGASISGVITMGLPQLSEIAWRWSDFTSWITKKDADEPSVRATDYLAAIAPVPLVMIQSTKDEYVPEADYRAIEMAAREPKRQVLIAASNHRFTDRIAELRVAYADGLSWISGLTARR